MLFRVLLIASLFWACTTQPPPLDRLNQKVDDLERLILSLDATIAQDEARKLSKSSIFYTLKLAKKYKAISSPWLQNTLVNIGLKPRGLCHEWTEDLLRYLVAQNYKSLEFHAVGANIGSLNEHNALAVSAKGKGIEKSILLDAWRNSGDLYFIEINRDKGYKWEERRGLYGILPPKGGRREQCYRVRETSQGSVFAKGKVGSSGHSTATSSQSGHF